MRKRIGQPIRIWVQRLVIGLLVLTLIALLGALSQIPAWGDPPAAFDDFGGRVVFYPFLVVAVLITALLLRSTTGGLIRMSRFEQMRSIGRRNIAVIPLSLLTKIELQGDELKGSLTSNDRPTRYFSVSTSRKGLEFLRSCHEGFKGSSWEIAFLVLRSTFEESGDHLEDVVFFGSTGSSGSADQFENVRKALQSAIPEVTFHSVAANFFDPADAYWKLNETLRRIVTKKGFRRKRIVIDVTGGMAGATIACALSSMSRNQVFTYGKTNRDTSETELMVFDVSSLSDDLFLRN